MNPCKSVRAAVYGLLVLIVHSVVVISADFSYDDPDRWAETDPACAGSRQSPIDIVPSTTVAASDDEQSLKLHGFYRKPVSGREQWTHGTVYVRLEQGQPPTDRYGWPIAPRPVRIRTFHFHWGAEDDRGSEHTFDGQALALEVHFVFFNREYGTFEKAVEQPDGLTVLGALYNVRGDKAKGDAKWARPLPKIRDAGSATTVEGKDVFSLSEVAGGEWERYYSYPGSLTTPPCAESVTWIVRNGSIPVAPKDLRALRNLLDSNGEPLVDNFRPVQPLNDRTVTRYGF
ncbi:LOW QUALITY PROTEIN: carbonic anhydrase-like [Anopheles darlingi]|uniref:LOW QUALITY PROTEIN: carbonic anhydrase-like n=1 Tax=Anopheles darlingi TaxID=43151 RepID=UPI0021005C78|nr:LOW QUALITY PROTEIN: carbonic anhydrase-like [Anopheles darlingi]